MLNGCLAVLMSRNIHSMFFVFIVYAAKNNGK